MNRRSDVVFIITGDPAMREELRRRIHASGLDTVSFGSAAEYLAFAQPERAACLILDVLPPDANGLELYRTISNASGPAVCVTRQPDIACSVRALKCGAVDFLAFPTSREELLRAVHVAVDRNRSTCSRRQMIKELEQRLALLTPRESQVLSLVVSGLPNKRIAAALGISTITVQIHRGHVMKKMAALSFAHLVRIADALQVPLTQAGG